MKLLQVVMNVRQNLLPSDEDIIVGFAARYSALSAAIATFLVRMLAVKVIVMSRYILYFVIEYRRDSGRGPNSKYKMVANNVRPRKRAYTIRGLDSASRYYIKV